MVVLDELTRMSLVLLTLAVASMLLLTLLKQKEIGISAVAATVQGILGLIVIAAIIIAAS